MQPENEKARVRRGEPHGADMVTPTLRSTTANQPATDTSRDGAAQDVELGRIAKNKREFIKVAISEFQGARYLNVPTWFLDPENDAERPTAKGLNLRLDRVGELADLVEAAIAAARSRGWLPDGERR